MSGLSVIILGMLIVAVTSYNGIHKIGNEIKEISEYESPLLNVIIEIEKDILKEEILTLELLLSSKDVNSAEFKLIEKKIKELEAETNRNILECERLALRAANHTENKKLKKDYMHVLEACKKFEVEQKQFEKDLMQLENDLKAGHLDNVEHEKKVILDELAEMDHQVVELVQGMEKLSHGLAVQAEKDEESVLFIVEIVSVIFFIFAIIIAVVLNKDVKRNICNFQVGLLGFFNYLNRESTTVEPLDDSRHDEIGNMAKVVNENITRTKEEIEKDRQVIDDAIAVLSEFEQGDLCQRVTSTSNNPALKELTSLLNQMGSNIEINIDKALDILEQYSQNNYLNRVSTDNIKEHLLKLANSVNMLGNSTTELLLGNLQKGMVLKENSTLLSNNVSKLSVSSNHQAASLEETAAALEEITSTIVANGENVASMSSLANDLSTAVTSGEKLAAQTSTSMNEIDEKVSSINDAITIIDEIAFQTNILSLNAAVEAATAGEAGKGFAVVAQEVRNLASRSAEAANEIKSLVESATQKADEGKEISTKMIEGYNHLNETISTTVGLINDVSTASTEQQKGIEQINDAVSMLDKATQENAMIASQTDKIAKETNEMAVEIVEEVNKSEFKGKNN